MDHDQIVDRYFECVNAENWEGLDALWADDAVYKAVGTRPRHGRADIMGYFRRLFTSWALHDDRPGRRLRGDDAMSVEVMFTGTTRDGRPVSFEAVDVFEFRDGRIVRLNTWYDLQYVRKAVGAAAEADARPVAS